MTCFTPDSLNAFTRAFIDSTPEVPWYTVVADVWASLASEGAFVSKEVA